MTPITPIAEVTVAVGVAGGAPTVPVGLHVGVVERPGVTRSLGCPSSAASLFPYEPAVAADDTFVSLRADRRM